jgi:hypothetical protein
MVPEQPDRHQLNIVIIAPGPLTITMSHGSELYINILLPELQGPPPPFPIRTTKWR